MGFEALIARYSEWQNLIALFATCFALWSADAISKGKYHFYAHIGYSFSNVALIIVYLKSESWELALMAVFFLKTSLNGCYFYRSKEKLNEPAN